ncbi:MAG: NUDIX domain-containing protein [Deltaproteobacteria bacterium]|nr:NUDIX domain-containing protein [Deltaproteobacteria bacterium]
MSAGPLEGRLEVTCAVILSAGRLLLARRADTGLWEMPGGKVQPGEGLREGLAREIAEELGTRVAVGPCLGSVEEPRPPGTLALHAFLCRLAGPAPRALEHLELTWAAPEDLAGLELCPADRRLVEGFGDIWGTAE